jgi:hypothetical protein
VNPVTISAANVDTSTVSSVCQGQNINDGIFSMEVACLCCFGATEENDCEAACNAVEGAENGTYACEIRIPLSLTTDTTGNVSILDASAMGDILANYTYGDGDLCLTVYNNGSNPWETVSVSGDYSYTSVPLGNNAITFTQASTATDCEGNTNGVNVTTDTASANVTGDTCGDDDAASRLSWFFM